MYAIRSYYALWVGHLDWSLGTGATIKSTIGWMKGWALIPLFLLAGAGWLARRTGGLGAEGLV